MMYSVPVKRLIQSLRLGMKLKPSPNSAPHSSFALLFMGRIHFKGANGTASFKLHGRGECPHRCVPVRGLLDLLKSAKGERVCLFDTNDPDELMVDSFVFRGCDPEKFPRSDSVRWRRSYFGPDGFKALETVAHAAGKSGRSTLLESIALYPWHPQFRSPIAVATDGHRVSIETLAYSGPHLIIPLDIALLACEAFGKKGNPDQPPPEFKTGTGHQIRWESDDVVIESESRVGNYPDFTRVIPAKESLDAFVELPEQVEMSLRPAFNLAKSEGSIRIETGVNLNVRYEDPDKGKWDVAIGGCRLKGKKAVFAVKARYLLDILTSLGHKALTIGMNAGDGVVDSPLVFFDAEKRIRSILMPMMLEKSHVGNA